MDYDDRKWAFIAIAVCIVAYFAYMTIVTVLS